MLLPLLRRADGLAVTSAYVQEIFSATDCRHGRAQPARAEEHPAAGQDQWPPLMLWIDDLEERANPQMALHALAELRKRVPEARLLMAGSGSLAGRPALAARWAWPARWPIARS